MKITSHPQNLSALIDQSKRDQQQVLQDQQDSGRKKAPQITARAQEVAPKSDRQSLIEANRDALAKLQERLKADDLKKVKTDLAVGNNDRQNKASAVNLNHRENLGSSNNDQPTFTHIGQIIDIRV